MKLRTATAAWTAILALAVASESLAHPMFAAGAPGRSATVAAPKELRVSFSEAVMAKGSSFELTDAAGKAVKLGAIQADPKDGKTLIVPVPAKLTGAYRVKWKIAAPGHASVPGGYRFEVKP